jgi:hypothetical protein
MCKTQGGLELKLLNSKQNRCWQLVPRHGSCKLSLLLSLEPITNLLKERKRKRKQNQIGYVDPSNPRITEEHGGTHQEQAHTKQA